MKTRREKLLERWTFDTYYEHISGLFPKGIYPMGKVIKLQVLYVESLGVCARCGSKENLTADHVFPAVFLKLLGYPVATMFRKEWYQCLCKTCNIHKSSRVEWDNPVTYHILNRAMEEKPTWEYGKMQKEEQKLRQEALLRTEKRYA